VSEPARTYEEAIRKLAIERLGSAWDRSLDRQVDWLAPDVRDAARKYLKLVRLALDADAFVALVDGACLNASRLDPDWVDVYGRREAS
jgi:hypothetical protein